MQRENSNNHFQAYTLEVEKVRQLEREKEGLQQKVFIIESMDVSLAPFDELTLLNFQIMSLETELEGAKHNINNGKWVEI